MAMKRRESRSSARYFDTPGRPPFYKRYFRVIARLITVLSVVVAMAFPIGFGFTAIGREISRLPNVVALDPLTIGALEPLNQRSVVEDRYGNVIATLKSEQNRLPVSIDQIPKHLIDAVLAVEDAQFYRHKGLNLRSTARALFANVESGGVAQGGSTITQQLVKISLLSSTQKVDRKVREARLALQIERELTKSEILERYLNAVYFGQGSYGVQAASERYFAKPVSQLTIPESAFLAGMIRNPVGYDPVRFRERSRQRRSVVLQRLVDERYITEAQADEYRLAPMPHPADRLARPETYFIEEVKQRLLDDRRLGETDRDRYNAVFNGGLRIRTTFDPVSQQMAEVAVQEQLPSDEPQFTAALVAVEVGTGAVRAMVGGRGFDTDKYNLVTQGRRQPGSSWKPIVLLAALESGISPTSLVNGAEPCPIPNPAGEPDPYSPKNASKGGGLISIVDQLVISNNCAYARLAYLVGYDKIAEMAKRIGITTQIDRVPAMALGVEEVRPIDMAGAYATIASEGVLRVPYLIQEVRNRDGELVFSADTKLRQVVDPEVARITLAAMKRVVESGTGTAAQLKGREVAGKTGTTNSYEDAWFVGATPQLATAVWMGSPSGKIAMKNVGGINVVGGSYPAQIWHQYMANVLENQPVLTFTEPDPSLFGKADCLAIVANRKELVAQLVAEKKLKDALPTTTLAPSSRGFAITVQSQNSNSGSGSGSNSSSKAKTKSKSKKRSSTRYCTDRITGYSKNIYSGSSSSASSETTTKSTRRRRKTTKPVVNADASQSNVVVDIPTAPAQPAPAPVPDPVPTPDPAPVPDPAPAVDGG